MISERVGKADACENVKGRETDNRKPNEREGVGEAAEKKLGSDVGKKKKWS